jgi:hypothetical protein
MFRGGPGRDSVRWFGADAVVADLNTAQATGHGNDRLVGMEELFGDEGATRSSAMTSATVSSGSEETTTWRGVAATTGWTAPMAPTCSMAGPEPTTNASKAKPSSTASGTR